MKKQIIFVTVFLMCAMTNTIRAGSIQLVNGSFEVDGWIDDISVEEPNGWDVNMPTSQFAGWIHNDWPTDGFYNLTVYSYRYQAFEANDMTTVSQYVNLTDVNSIVLDLKLSTYPVSKKWDPNKRTAGVLIDDCLVWQASKPGDDLRGEYWNQFIPVDFSDRGLHKLSLALIADVNETSGSVDRYYYTFWDNIGFDLHCGGHGFLKSDFSKDCFVDANDLAMFTGVWGQTVDANSIYNLYRNDDVNDLGKINFRDYSVFAQDWLKSSND